MEHPQINVSEMIQNEMQQEQHNEISQQPGQVISDEQMQVQPQQDNPFAAEQYRNIPIPDNPINYGGGIAESMLNDEGVPDNIKKKYWFVFHRDNVLTFLDKERKHDKLLNFDISKIDLLNSIPYYDYTFDKELEFNILRNVLETKLDRAMGFTGSNIKNERVMLQSQFSEQRQISEHGNQGPIRDGFFKKLLGRR